MSKIWLTRVQILSKSCILMTFVWLMAQKVSCVIESDICRMITNGLGRLANRREAGFIVKITKLFHSIALKNFEHFEFRKKFFATLKTCELYYVRSLKTQEVLQDHFSSFKKYFQYLFHHSFTKYYLFFLLSTTDFERNLFLRNFC